MEGVLVSAVTGVLEAVLGKLALLLGDEYRRFKGVHGEIESLTRELAAMNAFLLKMEEDEDPDPQDKVWMNEVRELSYDMEDTIDDFMNHVDDKDTKPDCCMEKIKSLLRKMKARRRIGKEIEDLKKQFVEVAERNERYKTREAFFKTRGAFSNTNNSTVDPRALVIFEHASKLVGIDEPKEEIIKLLTEEDESAATQEQLKLVSIVGSGGMGKTTLANQVYRQLRGRFTCHAFVSVSRNPDMMNILRTILSEVSGQRYADTDAGSIQQLIGKISDFLEDKRYLIVIDDIWDENTWDGIKCAFPVNSCGSRIITTTRINCVAESCRSSFKGDIYNIKPLNMVHSRQLFNRRLFDSKEDCPSYLEDVSEQILKKCAGLPLAIIAISGLLANKERTKHIWNEVKYSIGRALERNPSVEGMMKILSLSYFDLPPHLKTCLLYLSIFPEDYTIEKRILIRGWIGEGFIHKEDMYTAHEIGERCFNELVNRSLIQPGRRDKYDRVDSCRVHDTILDFIISKSMEENFITVVGVPILTTGGQSKVVRRLVLQANKHGDSLTPTGFVLSRVRSLTFFVNNPMEMILPSKKKEMTSCLDELRHLRVVNFGGYDQLENHHLANIGRLFQLRYLNLRKTRVSVLPEHIGHVGGLEILDIRGTNVQKLPASLVNLRRLMHLLVDTGVIFPDGIGKMQALEMLKRVSVFKQSFNFVQQVGQLKNLRKLVLNFEGGAAEGVKEEWKKTIASFVSELRTRNTLSIYSKKEEIDLMTVCNHEFSFLLGQWHSAPVRLRKLKGAALRVPYWVCFGLGFQELRDVNLEVESIGQQDVCNLGGLPALLILNLTVTVKSKDKLRVSADVGFQCLRELCYHSVLFGGMDLMFAAGSMPKLEKLDLVFHAAESDSLSSDAIDFGIGNLPCLVTLKCEVLGWLQSAVADVKAYLKGTARAHPNHPTLFLA